MQDLPDAADVTSIFLETDRHPLLLGATRAVHREDGVTELRDGRGAIKAALPTEDFEAIARWRERAPRDE